MATAGLESVASLLYLHVPWTRMIEEGVDGASRAGAQRITGPAYSASTRAVIEEMARRHGWNVTIDLCAANCNKFVQRFASWTDEPDSEVVNAFTIRSWNQSMCICGKVHRETRFIYPPKGLKRTVVKRARSDGVKAVIVVHTRQATGWLSETTQSISLS